MIPPGVAAITGIGAHKGAAIMNIDKMQGHEIRMRSIPEYQAFGRDEVTARFSQGVHFTGTAKELRLEKGMAVDRVVAFIKTYHDKVNPLVKPIAVEHPFVIKQPGLKFDLAGRIDLVEKYTIHDLKTSAVSLPEYAAMTPQMMMYTHWFKMKYRRLPREVIVDGLKSTHKFDGRDHTFPINYKRRTVKPTKDMVRALYSRILTIADILDACQEGKIDPLTACPAADPRGWVCTAQYCGYANSCDSWTRRLK